MTGVRHFLGWHLRVLTGFFESGHTGAMRRAAVLATVVLVGVCLTGWESDRLLIWPEAALDRLRQTQPAGPTINGTPDICIWPTPQSNEV